ncbi:hypothetical protein ASPZODRAFT_280245 [Penicilliopsis zonata CBS 506.65]|uniref:Uncharacterized protein n=1 Tax=Penicilliopsis zonata CBS 506.65 TaxID=1073090 RepID=A0A1L9SUJ4_9EURO|nr:hypothetical protein ASPZODRAFT_280245 [Penicilliopsis zonata CBS 506.65]OJJ50880.1 hypothetical protein ASPZODRAFT_280245 [Penicilliopsis zonata CBS 506.65]
MLGRENLHTRGRGKGGGEKLTAVIFPLPLPQGGYDPVSVHCPISTTIILYSRWATIPIVDIIPEQFFDWTTGEVRPVLFFFYSLFSSCLSEDEESELEDGPYLCCSLLSLRTNHPRNNQGRSIISCQSRQRRARNLPSPHPYCSPNLINNPLNQVLMCSIHRLGPSTGTPETIESTP